MNGDFLCPHLREATAASLLQRLPRGDKVASDGNHLQCLVCWKVLTPAAMEGHLLLHSHDFARRVPQENEENGRTSPLPIAIYCNCCHDYVYFQQQAEPSVLVAEQQQMAIRGPDPVPKDTKVVFNEMMNGEIHGAESTLERPFWRVRGLVNLGQTCYFNSVLQAILHNPVLASQLLKEGMSNDSLGNQLIRGKSHVCGYRPGTCIAKSDFSSLNGLSESTDCESVDPDQCFRCELTSLACDPAYFRQLQLLSTQRTFAKRLKKGRTVKNPHGLMLKKKRRIVALDCIDWPKPDTLSGLVNPVAAAPPVRGRVETSALENVVVPDKFLTELWKKNTSLVPGEQQDAHECFVSVTSLLEEFDQVGPPKRSRSVSKIFQGIQRSDLMCCNCGRTSTMEEPFRDLSLSLLGVTDSTSEQNFLETPVSKRPIRGGSSSKPRVRPFRSRKRARIQIKLSENGADDGANGDAEAEVQDANSASSHENSTCIGARTESVSFNSKNGLMASPSTSGGGRSPVQGRPKTKSRWGPAVSLEQLLESYTTAENLTQNIACATCGMETRHTKKLTLRKTPKVLVLHMKRFDPASGNKLCRVVNFPLCGLDLTPFQDCNAEDRDYQKEQNGRIRQNGLSGSEHGAEGGHSIGVAPAKPPENTANFKGKELLGGTAVLNGSDVSLVSGAQVPRKEIESPSKEEPKPSLNSGSTGWLSNLCQESILDAKNTAEPCLADELDKASELNVSPVYDLFALVEHKGENSNAGHYVSYVNVPSLFGDSPEDPTDEVEIRPKWYKCDDTSISDAKDEEIQARQAYMLFYCRRDAFEASLRETHQLRRSVAQTIYEMYIERLRERREVAAADMQERVRLSKQRIKMPATPSPSGGNNGTSPNKRASSTSAKQKGRAKQNAKLASEAMTDKSGSKDANASPETKAAAQSKEASPKSSHSKASPQGSAGKGKSPGTGKTVASPSPTSRSRKRSAPKNDAPEASRRNAAAHPSSLAAMHHVVPPSNLSADGGEFDLDFSLGLAPGMEQDDIFNLLQPSPQAPVQQPAPKARPKAKSRSRPRSKKNQAQQSPPTTLQLPLEANPLKLLQANLYAQANGQHPQAAAAAGQDLSALRINPMLSPHASANPSLFVYGAQNAAGGHARPTARSKGKGKARAQPSVMIDPFLMLANGKHGN